MDDWIPFEEGKYLVEQAFLVTPENEAVALGNPYIEVFTGRSGKKMMNGGCLVLNVLMIELLEDHDDLDIILDLGGEFKYLLRAPDIQGGKVFSPDVKSSLRFTPRAPWEKLPEAEFDNRLSRLKMVSS